MKFYELAWSFFRKMLQMRSRFATTCTTTGTRGAKLPVDATSSGRSMVEMLGVLAIIGVLSVGAISGYSKAMMKYKLNKQAEQLNTIAAAIVKNANILYSSKSDISQIVTLYLYKMNELPSLVFKSTKPNYVYDIFGNEMYITVNNKDKYITLSIELLEYQQNQAMCQNIFSTFKQFASILWLLEAANTPIGNASSDRIYHRYYGDEYCKTNKDCVKYLSLAQIEELCFNIQVGQQRTSINILWN